MMNNAFLTSLAISSLPSYSTYIYASILYQCKCYLANTTPIDIYQQSHRSSLYNHTKVGQEVVCTLKDRKQLQI